MNKDKIPKSLHVLIPLVEKYGLHDDGYRDELIESLGNDELEILVGSISDGMAGEINGWFCNPNELKNPSQEYLDYSVFFMAFEYARIVLDDRNANRHGNGTKTGK